MRYRQEKVNSLIREELAKIILRAIEFPDSLVTITEVDTEDNMDKSVVSFSVLPPEKAGDVLKIFNRNSSRLNHLLAEKIHIKPMPRIVFEIDHSLEKAARIEKILQNDKID